MQTLIVQFLKTHLFIILKTGGSGKTCLPVHWSDPCYTYLAERQPSAFSHWASNSKHPSCRDQCGRHCHYFLHSWSSRPNQLDNRSFGKYHQVSGLVSCYQTCHSRHLSSGSFCCFLILQTVLSFCPLGEKRKNAERLAYNEKSSPVKSIDWTETFFRGWLLGYGLGLILHYFDIKLLSDESSIYVESNENPTFWASKTFKVFEIFKNFKTFRNISLIQNSSISTDHVK